MAGTRAKLQPAAVGVLNPDDPFQGLTSAQQVFVSLSFSGLNDREAYRQAFNVSDPNPGHVHAVSHNPLVEQKLRELVNARDRQSTLSAWLTKDWILHGIANLAQTADKDSTRLQAFIALGKTAGVDLFRETVRHEQVTRTVEDVETELKQKLDALRAGLTIEGSSRSAGSSKPAAPKDRRRKPAK